MDGISNSQNELNLILDQWEDRGVVKKELFLASICANFLNFLKSTLPKSLTYIYHCIRSMLKASLESYLPHHTKGT